MYQGPIHCFRTVLQKEGIAGIYRGMGAMLLRDVPGYCLYFIPYTFFCGWITPDGCISPNPASIWLAGGVAGKHLLPHNWPKKDWSVLGLGSRASLGLPVRRGHEADDFFLPQGHGGTPVHTCLDGCSVHLDRPVCASSLICSLPTPWWFLSCRSLKADQS